MRMDEVRGQSAAVLQTENAVLEIAGRMITIDVHGHLVDTGDWSAEVTIFMAEQDGVVLNDDHWILIDFLNRFYIEYDLAPELAVLQRNLCKDQNDCRWTRRFIKSLFPGGAKTACRYAGLPTPVGRSCG